LLGVPLSAWNVTFDGTNLIDPLLVPIAAGHLMVPDTYVPEPAAMALLLAPAGLLARRRTFRSRRATAVKFRRPGRSQAPASLMSAQAAAGSLMLSWRAGLRLRAATWLAQVLRQAGQGA